MFEGTRKRIEKYRGVFGEDISRIIFPELKREMEEAERREGDSCEESALSVMNDKIKQLKWRVELLEKKNEAR